ncbi:hypothetical protein Hypma_001560 [Hypsizygus marmoreus]|uniref:MULE transposase domain-containing protein n=1 Tax=Hypsizygus marmoreus TaxID=39966 RepID=A0A369K5Y7_HYPMA|nr:hypothetical protein Hypma_001560 [Hypsizygus marmoreus]
MRADGSMMMARWPLHRKSWKALMALTLTSFISLIKKAFYSIWKTSAVGYKLYRIIREAEGWALPLAFVFTASCKGSHATIIHRLKKDCPNLKFAYIDKNKTEIKVIHDILMEVKSQLCYWHAMKYLHKQLVEDTAPAAYNLRVYEDDAECPEPEDGEDKMPEEAPMSTCCLPVLVVIGPEGKHEPACPDLPKIKKLSLLIFCPKEHWESIIQKL